MLLAIGVVTAFLAIFVGVLVSFGYSHERQQLARTLEGATGGPAITSPMDLRRAELAAPVWNRAILPALRTAGRFGRRFTPLDVYRRLEEELVYAGNPPGWDVERVIALKVILPIGLGLLGLFAWNRLELDTPLGIGVVLLFAAVGYYAPEWLVRSRAEARQSQIRRALPDSLDLLSITVEAGLGFDAALTRVAQNIRGPLGQELYRVVQEIQLGKSRSEALRDLADRTNVEELRSFILAMVQADTFGIPIARVLSVQASEIRLRRRQRAEEQAQKLPVKIVFPLILGIFPAIFVVLLGPAMIQIYEALTGTI